MTAARSRDRVLFVEHIRKGAGMLSTQRQTSTRRRGRLVERLGVAVGALALLGGTVPAGASVSGIYTGTGYDVSYPNCNSPLPSSASFAIIGVGGGRPFTANTCASDEWTAASKVTSITSRSLYFNTGYAGGYAKSINPTCVTDLGSAAVAWGSSRHEKSQEQQAWEIGCSEALYAQGVQPGRPSAWWADVETLNSWSANTTLNRYVIDGLSSGMSSAGVPFGYYSSPAMWGSITGSLTWAPPRPVPALSGVWVAGGACPSTTGSSQMAGGPTWLAQSGTSSAGVDLDKGC